MIKNRNYNLQDFREKPDALTNLTEILILNSVKDKNKLCLNYLWDSDIDGMLDNQTHLVGELLSHEGQGGLYQTLNQLGYLESMSTDDNDSFETVLWAFVVEFTLTDKGIENWQEVLSIYFKFLEFTLSGVDDLPLFDEIVKMSKMSFNYYKVPEQLENCENIASRMQFLAKKPERMNTLLKAAYDETIVEKVDMAQIKTILGKLDPVNAKIIL